CWWRKTTGQRECYEVSKPRSPVGAIGLTPLGIKMYYSPVSRVRLFGALAGGFVAFDRATPVVAASAVNFAAEYQLGAEIGITDARALEVAWKFQHWSNANLTYFNPGLDVNLITLGFKRRR
ncbi:MAG TPA: acyloxyacyl hydrolase, partial [Gemmatimonadaceae bacterium]